MAGSHHCLLGLEETKWGGPGAQAHDGGLDHGRQFRAITDVLREATKGHWTRQLPATAGIRSTPPDTCRVPATLKTQDPMNHLEWGAWVGADLPGGKWNSLQDQQKSFVLPCTPPSSGSTFSFYFLFSPPAPVLERVRLRDPQIHFSGWPVHRTLLRQPAVWGKQALYRAASPYSLSGEKLPSVHAKQADLEGGRFFVPCPPQALCP